VGRSAVLPPLWHIDTLAETPTVREFELFKRKFRANVFATIEDPLLARTIHFFS
jgi:hypothetical protein